MDQQDNVEKTHNHTSTHLSQMTAGPGREYILKNMYHLKTNAATGINAADNMRLQVLS